MTYLPFTRPTIGADDIAAVGDTLASGWLATGPRCGEFERDLSAFLGGRPVRVVTSGTAALEIALQLAGIGPGDEVVTPALSFVATPNMIAKVGARPVFVDVDPVTRNMNVEQAEAAVTPRTRALMPVHFAGLAADQDGLYDLARRRGLRVIEDAAHAIGTQHAGRRIGSFGDLVVFSFHPNKNMTSIEGGALAMSDADELRRLEPLRFHGITRAADGSTVDVDVVGGKFNLPDVNARLGITQLRRLDGFNARRRELAQRYLARMRTDPPVVLPADDPGHSWHIFAPLIPFDRLTLDRSGFLQALKARDIGSGVHYPALHLFSLYRKLGYGPGDFPHAERIGRETVTLPLFPAMTDADVDRVCDAVAETLAGARR